MDHFKGKVSIVTGAASGIGKALCEELGRKKAVVVAADINTEGARKVASKISKDGGISIAAHLDVSRSEDVAKLIHKTANEYGRLDYIFNNAGISIWGEARDMDLSHWEKVIAVNLMGVVYGTSAAYALMVKQGFGHIVNIASIAGLISFPTNVSYATSKSAVIGLSTSLRFEGAELGVKVSAVCPGYIDTAIYDAGTYLRVDREKVIANIKFNMMDAKKAAPIILKGVTRNRAVITFPLHAGLLWWLYRLNPSLLNPFIRKTVMDFRAIRTK